MTDEYFHRKGRSNIRNSVQLPWRVSLHGFLWPVSLYRMICLMAKSAQERDSPLHGRMARGFGYLRFLMLFEPTLDEYPADIACRDAPGQAIPLKSKLPVIEDLELNPNEAPGI